MLKLVEGMGSAGSGSGSYRNRGGADSMTWLMKSDPPKPAQDQTTMTHRAMRRVGGARVAVSKRVRVLTYGPTSEVEGWLLNASRGGVRLICEMELREGDRVVLEVGDEEDPEAYCRPARVVWVQSEADGVIAGLAFTDGQSDAEKPAEDDLSSPASHAPSPAAHDPKREQGASAPRVLERDVTDEARDDD